MRRVFTYGLVVLVLLALAFCALWWSAAPPAPVVAPRSEFELRDVTLVQPGEWRREHALLRVRSGLIEAVSDSENGAIASAWAGHFVVPGLIDLHVHYAPRFFPGGSELFGALFLRHGVTAVRDVGSFSGDALESARRVAAGDELGPRIESCGPFVDGARSQWPGSLRVRSAEQVDRVVAALRERGARCMKLYNDLSPDAVVALIEAGASAGLAAIAHVPSHGALAAYRGAEIQHLMELVPSWPRLRDADVERAVALSRRLALEHTPTLVAFSTHASSLATEGAMVSPAARWLPGFLRDLLWSSGHNPVISFMLGDDDAHAAARLAGMGRVVLALREAGVPLFLGSDTPNPGVVPGASLLREIEVWVALGVPREEVWRRATRLAGEKLGWTGLGRIAVGAPADLLVYERDPTRSARAGLVAVVADGRLYRIEELEGALDAMRTHFEGEVYDGATRRLTRALLAAPELLGRADN